jgi:hypothetical protein
MSFTNIRSETAAGLEKAAEKIAPKGKALPIPAFGDFSKAANDVGFIADWRRRKKKPPACR